MFFYKNRELRDDAVVLVDAFDYTDLVLGSCIGVKTGDVYQTLLEKVGETAGIGTVPSYYESDIKPMLEGDDLIEI